MISIKQYAVLLALAGPLLGVAAHAGEPVEVRAGAHAAYGRIVFEWPSPVEFDVAISDNRLVVEFARPMTTDLLPVTSRLASYVSKAAIDKEGRIASFQLTGSYAFTSRAFGRKVVVDLMRSPVGENAGDAPVVQTRVGRHPGFDRLVFDWRRVVKYQVAKTGGNVTVRFDHQAQIDVDGLRGQIAPRVGVVSAAPGESGLEIALSVADTARLRHFRRGLKVVVDILHDAATLVASDVSAAGADQETAQPIALATQPQTAPEMTEQVAPAPPTPAANKPISLTPRAAMAPREPAPSAAASGQPIVLTPAPAPASAEASALSDVAPNAGSAEPAKAAPTDAPTAEVAAKTAAAQPTETAPPAAVAPTGSASLRFDWDAPVAAAVFRRSGYVWLVFDKPAQINRLKLEVQGKGLIADIRQVPADQHTLVRFAVAPGVNPNLRRDEKSWVVDLKPQRMRPAVAVDISAQHDGAGRARLFLPVSHSGTPITFEDPEVGDILHVVPVFPVGFGVDAVRNYPQFRLLATAQGIAVRPHADEVRVAMVESGIMITAEDGGVILAGEAQQAPAQPFAQVAQAAEIVEPIIARLFDFAAWRNGDAKDYKDARHELLREVAEADENQANRLRLKLVKFYFSHDLPDQALGVLRQVVANDPDLGRTPTMRALRGACHLLMGDYERADKALSHESLDGEPEAVLWRAALAASTGDWTTAVNGFSRTHGLMDDYPARLKSRISMLASEAALESGDIMQAQISLDGLATAHLHPTERGRLVLLRGRLLEAAGDVDSALEAWASVIAGPPGENHAEAMLAQLKLMLANDLIAPEKVVEQLDEQRFVWRGDDYEFRLLRQLGELRIQLGSHRAGLRDLKRAISFYPDHPETPKVSGRMRDEFAGLFLDGIADDLPPLTAIALYDEFRELTPTGEAGDRMIERLADRLVAVELLDRAAALLDHQVAFRLTGIEQARVASNLALVKLLDDQPEAALEALEYGRGLELPEILRRQRRHIGARARAALGRNAEAIDFLGGDDSRDADLIRADVYWQESDWAAADRVIARLVPERLAENESLDEETARFVLNWAVALSLMPNEDRVAMVRQKYGAAMKDTIFAEAFSVVTDQTQTGPNDYKSVTKKLMEAGQFQSFITSYRQRLQTEKLSAIN